MGEADSPPVRHALGLVLVAILALLLARWAASRVADGARGETRLTRPLYRRLTSVHPAVISGSRFRTPAKIENRSEGSVEISGNVAPKK